MTGQSLECLPQLRVIDAFGGFLEALRGGIRAPRYAIGRTVGAGGRLHAKLNLR